MGQEGNDFSSRGAPLVTDRTQADVDRWRALHDKGFAAMTAEERADWMAGMKGSYNAADLNRVGEAVGRLAAALRSCGYAVSVSGRTDWTLSDLPRQSDMDAYLGDLRTLRGVLAVLPDTPPVPPDMAGLTWREANDIEKLLSDVELLIHNMEAAWFYAGDLFSGEV